MVQSTPEASPVKWHLAHTAWFFETFILREFMSDYRLFNTDFPWLFNSYYQNLGHFPEKRLRSSFSRPGLDQILRYREHVDEAIDRLLERNPDPEALKRVELGVNHEEQHQEFCSPTFCTHSLPTRCGRCIETRCRTTRSRIPNPKNRRRAGRHRVFRHLRAG